MINQRLISFSSAFKHIRTIREISFFLTALLAPQEIIQIPKRLEALKMIAEGRDRRKIAEELKNPREKIFP